MKKQNMVATLGTLALVANLLLPGMAFGQADQEDQTASQNINCTGTPVFDFGDFPDAVSFDTLTASPSAQNSFDAVLNDDSGLPLANRLQVEDLRSNGVDGCPTTTPGFEVQATITDTLTAGLNTIPDSNFRVVTSNEFTGFAADCTRTDGEQVCYGTASGTGNLHDVTAPEIYDDAAFTLSEVWDSFNTVPAYTHTPATGGTEDLPNSTSTLRTTNTLDQSVVLLHTDTSHNQVVSTGVAIYGNIPGNQAPGAYTGTIQYTLTAV